MPDNGLTVEEIYQLTILEFKREEQEALTPEEYARLMELYDKKDQKLL